MNAQPEPIDDDLPEISIDTFEKIDRWAELIDKSPKLEKRAMFTAAAADLLERAQYEADPAGVQAIEEAVYRLGTDRAGFDHEDVHFVMIGERARTQSATDNNFSVEERDEPPPASNPDDYGTVTVALPKPPAPAVLKTPVAWPNEEPPPVDWLAFQRIPRGDVTTLHGDGGAGKTDIALRLAANVARHAPDWLGNVIADGPAVFISAEEPEREIRRRIWLHAQHDGYGLADLGSLRLWVPDDDAHNTVLATPDRNGIMRPTSLFDSIGVAIHELQPVLVVVDNVAATFGGNQVDRLMARTYVNLWRAVARIDSKPAILLLDHPSLSGLTNGSGRGGNMDWRNSVRSALYLRPADEKAEADRGIRILETAKSNYGPSGPATQIRLQWGEGGLERETTPSSFHKIAKDQECEQVFLRLLDERNAQGGHVGRKQSGMYAPKEFADAPNNGGFTKQKFAAAMHRLFTAGTIREFYDRRQRHNYIDRAEQRLAEASE